MTSARLECLDDYLWPVRYRVFALKVCQWSCILTVRIAIGRAVDGRFWRRATVNPLGDVSFGVEGAVAAWRSAFPAGAVDCYPCSWR